MIVVRDAVCSSSDQGHDALITLFRQRYTEQIEVADAAVIMERWECYGAANLLDLNKPLDRLF